MPVNQVRQSVTLCPMCLDAVSDNFTVLRRQNLLTLFQLYVEEQVRRGAAPKGLEQAFARQLQISPSMWSQVKSSRPVGDKLARQIEAACARPTGWLDEAHAAQGPTVAEQQFMALALKAWRAAPAEGRKRLKIMLKEVAAGASPGDSGPSGRG